MSEITCKSVTLLQECHNAVHLYLVVLRNTFIALVKGSGVAGAIILESFFLYKGDRGLFAFERIGGFVTEVEKVGFFGVGIGRLGNTKVVSLCRT